MSANGQWELKKGSGETVNEPHPKTKLPKKPEFKQDIKHLQGDPFGKEEVLKFSPGSQWYIGKDKGNPLDKAEAGRKPKVLISDKPLKPSEVSDAGPASFKIEPSKDKKVRSLELPDAKKGENVRPDQLSNNYKPSGDMGGMAMSEKLEMSAGGQWSIAKAHQPSDAEKKAFKESRDKYLREKHGMPNKEEHEKQLAANRGRDVPKSSKPDMSRRADKKYSEQYHSATRETAPGKFVHQGMPKPPPKDVSPPISKRPEFKGGGFERSPVRMSPSVKRK